MCDRKKSTLVNENKSSQLQNPNYASVRCTQPMPSLIELQTDLQCQLCNECLIDDNQQSINSQPMLLTNHLYEDHHSNKNNNRNELIQNQVGMRQKDKDNSDQSMQMQANTRHQKNTLGMFQYMKFERKMGSNGEDIIMEPQNLPPPEDHEYLTTKQKLMHILHSKPVHIIIIVLVIIDCFLVIFELLIDLQVITLPSGNPLPGIFHGFSIAILSVFMIEIMLKLYADYRHFIRHKVEVLDAVVVIVSFAVDVALVFFEDNEALAALGLLVLLRLWRVFRIVNGIIVTVKTKADERVHEMKEKLATLQNLYDETSQKLAKREQELQELWKILQDNNIDLNKDFFVNQLMEGVGDGSVESSNV